MLEKLCAQCNICVDLLETEDRPTLSYDIGGNEPLVLVLDQVQEEGNVSQAIERFLSLAGRNIPFTYSNVVRCLKRNYLSDAKSRDALRSRCSVWTHSIIDRRAVIVTTLEGLKQLRVDELKEGDIKRDEKLGILVVIPPLLSEEMDETYYGPRVRRALKEVGL